jgi:hypothetical protein
MLVYTEVMAEMFYNVILLEIHASMSNLCPFLTEHMLTTLYHATWSIKQSGKIVNVVVAMLHARKSTTCCKLISTGVNKVVRPTMNSIVNVLLQHCSTVTTWNNMVDNLFIVGRTTLFTPVDINLQQPVRF